MLNVRLDVVMPRLGSVLPVLLPLRTMVPAVDSAVLLLLPLLLPPFLLLLLLRPLQPPVLVLLKDPVRHPELSSLPVPAPTTEVIVFLNKHN
jgi:hypothetical protein